MALMILALRSLSASPHPEIATSKADKSTTCLYLLDIAHPLETGNEVGRKAPFMSQWHQDKTIFTKKGKIRDE